LARLIVDSFLLLLSYCCLAFRCNSIGFCVWLRICISKRVVLASIMASNSPDRDSFTRRIGSIRQKVRRVVAIPLYPTAAIAERRRGRGAYSYAALANDGEEQEQNIVFDVGGSSTNNRSGGDDESSGGEVEFDFDTAESKIQSGADEESLVSVQVSLVYLLFC